LTACCPKTRLVKQLVHDPILPYAKSIPHAISSGATLNTLLFLLEDFYAEEKQRRRCEFKAVAEGLGVIDVILDY